MLSQYSWGDFIKVVLVVLFVYYAYVLWAYYRQDIWDWFTNRSAKPDLQAAVAEVEEEDLSSYIQVSTYADPAPARFQATAEQPTFKADAPSDPAAQSGVNQAATPADDASTPDLDGVAIDDDTSTDFAMPIVADADRPAEQSVAMLIDAAQRLETNADGALAPTEPADQVAAQLADVINQQQGRLALAGISFNR